MENLTVKDMESLINTLIEQVSYANKMTVSPEEAARMSGIGENEIYRLCHEDPTFPVFKIGRKFRIYVKGLDEWIANHAKHKSGVPSIVKNGPALLKRRHG